MRGETAPYYYSGIFSACSRFILFQKDQPSAFRFNSSRPSSLGPSLYWFANVNWEFMSIVTLLLSLRERQPVKVTLPFTGCGVGWCDFEVPVFVRHIDFAYLKQCFFRVRAICCCKIRKTIVQNPGDMIWVPESSCYRNVWYLFSRTISIWLKNVQVCSSRKENPKKRINCSGTWML